MEEKEKKYKKKNKIKMIPLIIAFVSILVIALLGYLLTLIKISNIYIKGNTYINDQEIIEQAKLENYPSFIKTSTNTIKKRIKKNPYVKSVSVKKKLFSTIEIKIEEKTPLFRKDDNKLLVLDDGTEVDDNSKYTVPILLNYVPDTKYESFLKKMKQVNESVKSEISEIRYYPNNQDDDRFLLNMNDGNLVYLTLTKFKQINYYEDVLDQLDGKKGILYLDSGNHFKVMEENQVNIESEVEEK